MKGQASLEYLILLAAFLACFAAMLPVVVDVTHGFLFSSDELLAKGIARDVTEQASLFAFLGDGSQKVFEYSPASKVSLRSEGSELVVSSNGKEFRAECYSPQSVPWQDFSSNFSVFLKKDNGKVVVSVSAS